MILVVHKVPFVAFVLVVLVIVIVIVIGRMRVAFAEPSSSFSTFWRFHSLLLSIIFIISVHSSILIDLVGGIKFTSALCIFTKWFCPSITIAWRHGVHVLGKKPPEPRIEVRVVYVTAVLMLMLMMLMMLGWPIVAALDTRVHIRRSLQRDNLRR